MKSVISSTDFLSVANRTLTTGPENMTAIVGESVSLHCSSEIPDPVTWYFTPPGADQDRLIRYNGAGGKYNVNGQTSGHQNLTITSVDVDDTGRYTCMVARGSNKPGQTKFAYLTVKKSMIIQLFLIILVVILNKTG